MRSPEERVARQALAIRTKQQLVELSRDIQKWQGRVERSRTEGREDLVIAAEQRVQELVERGRQLWDQMQGLLTPEERFQQLEVDQELEQLKQQFKSSQS